MNKFSILFFLFLATFKAFSANTIVRVDTLLWNGGPYAHLQLVITNDGYLGGDVSQFNHDIGTPCADFTPESTCGDARKIFDKLFSVSPFKEYKNFFNVIAITTESNNSGIGPAASTNFDSFYSVSLGQYYGALHWNTSNMTSTLNTYAENAQAIVVISNDTIDDFGYSNGAYTYQTKSSTWVDIAVHELGHTIGLLGDSYVGSIANEKSNVTRNANPSLALWNNWIGTVYGPNNDIIGMYPINGFGNTIFYRPCPTDIMNSSNDDQFCPSTQEALIRRFHQTAFNMIDSLNPALGSVTISEALTNFRGNVKSITPNNTIKVTWTLNGTVISDQQESSINICVNQLNVSSSNTLTVKATDTTSAIRGIGSRWGFNYSWSLAYDGLLNSADCAIMSSSEAISSSTPVSSSSSAPVPPVSSSSSVPVPPVSSSSSVPVPPVSSSSVPVPPVSSSSVPVPPVSSSSQLSKYKGKWRFLNRHKDTIFSDIGNLKLIFSGGYRTSIDTVNIYDDGGAVATFDSVATVENYYTCSTAEGLSMDVLQPNKSWVVEGWYKKENNSGYLLSRSGNLRSDRSSVYVRKNNYFIRTIGGTRKIVSIDNGKKWNHFVWQNHFYNGSWVDDLFINGQSAFTNQSHGSTVSSYKLKIGCRGENVEGNTSILPVIGSFTSWSFFQDTILTPEKILSDYESFKQE